MIISVNHQPSGGKEWVAEITGRHPKYGFAREFLPVLARDWSSSGRTGVTVFALDDGKIYEVNAPYKGRCFIRIENGEAKEVSVQEVTHYISTLEKKGEGIK